jgi:hypothetical protein
MDAPPKGLRNESFRSPFTISFFTTGTIYTPTLIDDPHQNGNWDDKESKEFR